MFSIVKVMIHLNIIFLNFLGFLELGIWLKYKFASISFISFSNLIYLRVLIYQDERQ